MNRLEAALTALVVVAMLVLSCVPFMHNIIAGTPDAIAASGPRIYWNGQPAQDAGAVEWMIDHEFELAKGTCPENNLDAMISRWKNLHVKWMPSPFSCGNRRVWGCADGLDIYVSRYDVIYDEMGHSIWYSCFDRSGESTADGGFVTYDPDFISFLSQLKAGAP